MERRLLSNSKMLLKVIGVEERLDAIIVEKLDILQDNVLIKGKVNIFLSRWRKEKISQKKSLFIWWFSKTQAQKVQEKKKREQRQEQECLKKQEAQEASFTREAR